MSNIDFGALSEQAVDYLNTHSESAPSESQTPPPTQTTAPEGQAPPVEDDGIELEVDPGKKMRFTRGQLAEYYKNGLRQQDYTKKTQEIAAQRKQFESVAQAYQKMAEERQQIVEFLNNRELIEQFVSQKFGQPQDPNRGITAKEAQEMVQGVATQDQLRQLHQHYTNELQQVAQRTKQEAIDDVKAAKYGEIIASHVDKLMEEYPLLKTVPRVQDVMRFEVFEQGRVEQWGPDDIDRAKAAFTAIAKREYEKMEKAWTEHYKQKALNKNQLVQGQILPKGGATPGMAQVNPKQFSKNGDIDWKSVNAEAQRMIEEASRG